MKQVFCTLTVEGIHFWKDCDKEEVSYLSHPHRHLFVIKCFREVESSDRQVEFVMLKHQVGEFLSQFYSEKEKCCNFRSMSCEMIAENLLTHLCLSCCEVTEDGENGAIVTK